jgi:GDPmannose 4,6-dehydratase
LLQAAFDAAGLDNWKQYVRQDPKFMRPAEVDLLIGDASKAQDKLGWKPKVSFNELITMMVENDIAEQSALMR